MIDANDFEQLVDIAKSEMDNAYAPYSGFSVGSAVLTENGMIYGGCNVENSSYGLSICAERNAIFSAISHGERIIRAIAIVASNDQPAYPCGACRQVLSEFSGEDDISIYVIASTGVKKYLLSDMLPSAFKL